MDLAARKRAWTGSVARPGDVAVLSNCEDDDSRRWVVDAALGASGASGVVTRLAYAAAGLALDALPADGDAAPRRAALRGALRRHELYDRCAFAERAPYAARARAYAPRGLRVGRRGEGLDGGNDVNLCGDLLACLTFDDHERLADDDAAFAEARGPGVWALVDDLRAKVDVCRALRGDLKLFLPLRKLRDAAPRLDDADLDALAAPSDDLGVVDVDGPAEALACSSGVGGAPSAPARTFGEGGGPAAAAPRRDDPAAAAAGPRPRRRRGARRARAASPSRRPRGADDARTSPPLAASGRAGGARRASSAVAAKILAAPSVADLGDDDTGRFLAALVDDEDADFLEDLRSWRRGAGVAASAATRWSSARRASRRRRRQAQAPSPPPRPRGSRSSAAPRAATARGAGEAAAAGERPVGSTRAAAATARATPRRCGAATWCATSPWTRRRRRWARRGGPGRGRRSSAGAKAMALFDAAGAFLGAPRPAGDAADRARDEIFRAADAPSSARAAQRAAAPRTSSSARAAFVEALRRHVRRRGDGPRDEARPARLRKASPASLARRHLDHFFDAPRAGGNVDALASLLLPARAPARTLSRRAPAGGDPPATSAYAALLVLKESDDDGDDDRPEAGGAWLPPPPGAVLLKYLKGRYRKESDARPLDLLCRLVVAHCGQADATFCRVAQEHGLLLRRFARATKALGRRWALAGVRDRAAKATRAARMAVTAGGDPALVDAARGGGRARRRRARADVVLQAFLLLTGVGARALRRGAAPPRRGEAFANAAAALVLRPLFGDGEDGDRSLSRDAADAALAARRFGDRAGDRAPRAAARSPAPSRGAGARPRRRRRGLVGGAAARWASSTGSLGAEAAAAPAVAGARRDASARGGPAHPCFFAVSELVARGWGAERARHVAAGDLATVEGVKRGGKRARRVKALFADLLAAALAGPPGDLRKKARLLWSLLDLAHAREPPGDEDERRRADRRGASSAAEAVAALRGVDLCVNVDVDGEPLGLCWLQLLHALRGDGAAPATARAGRRRAGGPTASARRGSTRRCLPAPRAKAGLRAAHASVALGSGARPRRCLGAAPAPAATSATTCCGAARRSRPWTPAATAACTRRSPRRQRRRRPSSSRPFKVACVVLAAAARRHHGDFLAVARAAHAFAGTPPHLATRGPRAPQLLDDGARRGLGRDPSSATPPPPRSPRADPAG
ncbi:hypothetical protein JL721_3184 [Aureococcus anophagefferens]|nr:hypothetical protein JL721_3184 [Aureococcus anophagefferens]